MRITSKGQVTIPLEVREKMGFLPHTEVDFIVTGSTVRIVKAKSKGKSRSRKLIDSLRGKATVRMTTDEIMTLTRGEG